MDPNLAGELFDHYAACARRILDAGFGDNHAAPIIDAAVDLVLREPELRRHVLLRVSELMADRWGTNSHLIPEELAQVLAHVLQWPEFKVLVRDRLTGIFGGDRAAAAGDVALHIEQALQQDWEGREAYRPR